MRIAHTADIHWRGTVRHAEYRTVFKAFVDDCRDQCVDHIAIEGDIFHTKTAGISPEYIEQLTWWLKELANVVPYAGRPTVHLRLGNHDGNLVNVTRQDAVTPIVEALADPRIRLYKTSGTYEFAPGFYWCVFGIFDKQGWSTVKPVPGAVNIASYHGPVAGARSESDWEIEEGLTVDFFDDFDFAFLGDIHKLQHLAHRDGRPWVSYPGTPVQQNYAESVDHAYLMWDIRTRDDFEVVVRPLPNPQPFVTIDWLGSVEDTVAQITLNPGTRCRIRSQDVVTQAEMIGVSAALRRVSDLSEVTFKIERSIAPRLISAGDAFVAKRDLRSLDVLMRLLRDHHRDSPVSDVEWTAVTQRVSAYLETISGQDDRARNVRWSPRHLKFDNVFSYGEGNIINFDNLTGITGVFGPNRSGKSSIVGTLMYVLFNTTDRGPIKNLHVVNVRKQHCYGRFIVSVNDVDYVIERQTVKHENRKGIASANTSLNVFRLEQDGTLVDLCGEQRNDTEKVIRQLIGTSDDFQLTSLAAQEDANRFVREGSSQRRLILARFLDIEVFEKLYDCAKEDAKALKEVVRRAAINDHAAIERDLIRQLSECDLGLQSAQHDVDDINRQIDSTMDQLGRHGSFIAVTPAQIVEQHACVRAAKRDLDACAAACAAATATITDLNARLDRVKAVLTKDDPKQLKERLETLRALERDVATLTHAHSSAQADLQRSRRSLKTLESVPCGDAFPTCRFISDAHADRARSTEQELAAANAALRLADVEALLAQASTEHAAERLRKHEQAVQLLAQVTLELEKRRGELARETDRMLVLRSAHDKTVMELEVLLAAQQDVENVQVVELKAELDRLRTRSRELDGVRMRAAAQQGRLHSEIEKCRRSAIEHAELETQLRVFDLIASGCSKRGIPHTIVAAELPIINAEILRILHGIVDFTVELVSDDDGNAMDVFINYGDSRRLLETGSGMEKFISSIAIRVALINVSSLPKTDTLIIDEGFGSLDDTAREAAGRLLHSLKRYFRSIIVITHEDEIKDAVDNVLEITRIEKDSMVVHQ